MDKNVDEMSENELKEELKELYRKINDLSKDEIEQMDFEGKVTIEKKDKDGEVVQSVEQDL